MLAESEGGGLLLHRAFNIMPLPGISAREGRQTQGGAMYSIFVTIKIKPGFREKFMEASLGDGQGSVRDEKSCYRFDILQNGSDPNTFHLYEVYENEAALETHRTMPHFKKWRETVQDWFDGQPQRVAMTTIFPSDAGWKKQKPHLTKW